MNEAGERIRPISLRFAREALKQPTNQPKEHA
jgi:hypothetical protein